MSENLESNQNPEQTKPASFAELEQKDTVTVQELKETLQDYAESGAAILAYVVNSIIDRTELSPQDLQELRNAAQRGIEVQGENRLSSKQQTVSKEKREYQNVIDHIDSKK